MIPWLLIHNIGYTVSIFVTLGVSIFVLLRASKKSGSILFILLSLSLLVFEISHLFGVNVKDHDLSRQILMWNLTNIFIVIFNTHWILIILDKVKSRILPLSLVYLSGLTLFGFFLLNPEKFLINSMPKMYFPNYYVPGNWYLYMRIYFLIVSIYFLFEILHSYFKTENYEERLKYIFVTIGILFGYGFGSTALFLVFDININPVWSMLIGLYTIPFLYAMVNYELMEIKIFAKKAFFYALSVGALTGIISLINFSNEWLIKQIPNFPSIILPITSSIIGIWIGIIVWKNVREADILKYEFLTIVTHKFGTPLTTLKYASEELKSLNIPNEAKEDLKQIQKSVEKLFNLTNLIVNISDSEKSNHKYNLAKKDLVKITSEIIDLYKEEFSNKSIDLNLENKETIDVLVDETKIKFVIQTLIENALTYSKEKTKVNIKIEKRDSNIIFSIKDEGIGIGNDDIDYIFKEFFRGRSAKSLNIEGVGTGLFMSKKIIKHHKGKIWAESKGEGKGSEFYFSLPLVK